MAEHIYDKAELIKRFDAILGKCLKDIDTVGFFEKLRFMELQKGVVGTFIENCVLGYESDTKQDADLLVVENNKRVKTELKSTGMVLKSSPQNHFEAKEPMSITAVGVYDIADEVFETSHFWNKLEHLLLVYYHYTANHPVSPYEYCEFPITGYEFHEFSDDEKTALKQDWEHVHALVSKVVSHHPGDKTREWKEAVRKEYIDVHGELRQVLSYIDLAPKFPPRFRLKRPIVSTIISNHFGQTLEQLPGKYTVVTDIDLKCKELTEKYSGMTISEIGQSLGITLTKDNKAIAEQLIIAMFGGTSSKLNQIELFQKFGVIAKSITVTPKGTKTEDMKLFHIDFDEVTRKEMVGEDGIVRPMQFEDSDFYSYFADHEFICILFEEPSKEDITNNQERKSLLMNKFIGFKRLVFSDKFIDETVKPVWLDIREKIFNNTLVDVIQKNKDGSNKLLACGEISSAPNFMKSQENDIFIRGAGSDSSSKHKIESVNGIKMLPQYVWLKGNAVIKELSRVPKL
ncbi:MAG: hypothetical protein K2M89_01730 [Clostridiales bacterium]|nr:hypothetical protein [Clostridiales bacterium]